MLYASFCSLPVSHPAQYAAKASNCAQPDGIFYPIRNVLCHIGCRDLAQNVSSGVTNPAALGFAIVA